MNNTAVVRYSPFTNTNKRRVYCDYCGKECKKGEAFRRTGRISHRQYFLCEKCAWGRELR